MQKPMWYNSKRISFAIVISLMGAVLCWIIGRSIKTSLVFFVLFLCAGGFDGRKIKLNKPWECAVSVLWFVITGFIVLFLSQLIQNELLFTLPIKRIVLGEICCLLPMLVLFAVTLRIKFSTLFSAALLLLLSTANSYVYSFRGSELCPADFFSVGTAMNVMGRYTFDLPKPVAYAWLIFAAYIVFGSGLPELHIARTYRNRAAALSVSICLCVVFSMLNRGFPTQRFLHGGSFYNGFILNFTKEIPETFVRKPKGYSPENVKEISAGYARDDEQSDNRRPDIIVIMDEAYADLSILGKELNTNIPVSPYISSLKKNTSFGFTLTSAYGGGTPNSEYEFLSGNSLLFMNSVVYQQYIREPTYSLVSYLRDSGYYTIAMHPYLSNGWRRNTVWPNLMFDECMFLDSFPQKDLIRGFVSDREMFEVLLDTYEMRKKESNSPLFIFGVTMQNHSSYDYSGDDFHPCVHIEGYSQNYPDVVQYLSLVHETDKAVEYLLHQLEKEDHDVVVVFYGDHQPALDEAFLQEIHGGAFEALDERQLLQAVPFFIWTNYESESEEIKMTSLNFLSTRVLQKAGLPLPAYNRFLRDVEEQIPAMNVKGYYSLENDCFLPLSDAASNEKDILDKYWIAEYNSLLDLKHLDPVFFPIERIRQ